MHKRVERQRNNGDKGRDREIETKRQLHRERNLDRQKCPVTFV